MNLPACKTEQTTTFTFYQKDITASILENLTQQGYAVQSKAWNEAGNKLEVIAKKIEKKGGK